MPALARTVISDAARLFADRALAGESTLLDSEQHLRDALIEGGYGELEATELAAEWHERHDELVASTLVDWERRGIPPPAVPGRREGLYLTLTHERYAEDQDAFLPADFRDWIDLVEAASPKMLLLLVLACFRSLGGTHLYVIDGSDDHGVDCVGLLDSSPARGLVLLGQAKTSGGAIQQTTIRNDVREYREAFWDSDIGNRVRRALSLDTRIDGFAVLYCFCGGNRFSTAGSEYGARARILLRDSQQLAWHLSRSYQFDLIEELAREYEPDVRRDLEKDWSLVLDEAVAAP
jgi:hypothetical protein